MIAGHQVAYKIHDFLKVTREQFTGSLRNKDLQGQSWDSEYYHLKEVLGQIGGDGTIIFEYGIPSLSFVIDVVLLYQGKIFVLEYKDGDSATQFSKDNMSQVRNYALRLKYFHSTSNNRWIIPILVEMNGPSINTELNRDLDLRVWDTVKCNRTNLGEAIKRINSEIIDDCDDSWENDWAKGIYKVTPTIIKATCSIWEKQNVRGLGDGEADDTTRLAANDYIIEIVKESKREHKKSIVFVTGVPGAGKTIVGLGLSVKCQEFGASMLSGNDPLVKVLSTALRKDLERQYKNNNLKDEVAQQYSNSLSKNSKERDLEKNKIAVDAIIRTAFAYKREIIENRLNWEDGSYTLKPGADKGSQHVIIFDEAQRAWTKAKMLKPGQSGKKDWQYRSDWKFSEPGLLLWDMNQRDWGVFVCLVGGGQEINTGEAGIGEWLSALTSPELGLSDWDVYMSDHLLGKEYQRITDEGKSLNDYCKILKSENRLINDEKREVLHLTATQRSPRNENVSAFIQELLECNTDNAKALYQKVRESYQIYLTRDINIAKSYLRNQYSKHIDLDSDIRTGMLMSSEAARLRPLGFEIKKVKEYLDKTPKWFLDDPSHVCSSNFLEIALNEFFVQGLELDFTAVMWDADFRYNRAANNWTYHSFDGKKQWSPVDKKEQDIKRFYMKNAYRVLLTRARAGMIIFIPEGDATDETRKADIYDPTYAYLKSLGLDDYKI